MVQNNDKLGSFYLQVVVVERNICCEGHSVVMAYHKAWWRMARNHWGGGEVCICTVCFLIQTWLIQGSRKAKQEWLLSSHLFLSSVYSLQEETKLNNARSKMHFNFSYTAASKFLKYMSLEMLSCPRLTEVLQQTLEPPSRMNICLALSKRPDRQVPYIPGEN